MKNSFPNSLPKGSVLTWTFDTAVHNTPQALTIQSFELIPRYDDIRNIIELMPQAYVESARSVNLTLSIPGASPLDITYHFSKVSSICFISYIFRATDVQYLQFRLIQEVCNYTEPVTLAHRLLLHLHSYDILPPHVLQKFSRYAITSTINGFYSTKFPLWKLGYFLDEEWLQDEVLDGLAELVYFKAAATDNTTLSCPPTFLYLPTSILSKA